MILLRTIVGLLLTSCLTAAIQADELYVYSGRKSKFMEPLFQQFTETTGIKINTHYGNSSILLSTLSLEADNTKVDLFIGNDVGNLQRGSDFNLFHEMPYKLLAPIPKNSHSPYYDWVGLSGRFRVLVVNTEDKLAAEIGIDSVLDLANPKLKNKIGITHSRNESFIAGVTTYMHARGREKNRNWLQAIRENAGPTVFNKHSKIVEAVAKGKITVGLVNHYYAYSHIKKNPDDPIRIVFPDQEAGQFGSAWNMAGIAISRFSKKKEAAEKLVAFLVSEAGQKIFAEVNQEYPTRPNIPLASKVKPITAIKISSIPIQEIGRKREKTITEILRLGLK